MDESPRGKLVVCHRFGADFDRSAAQAWWRGVFGPAVHARRHALGFERYEQLHCESAVHPVRAAIALSRSHTAASLLARTTAAPDDAPAAGGGSARAAGERWDVLDELWWPSTDALFAALSSDEAKLALIDLHRLFESHSSARAGVVCAEHVIAAPASEQPTGARVAFCVRGRHGNTVEQSQQYWRTNHAALVKALAPRLDYDQYDQAHALSDPRAAEILELLDARQRDPYVGFASLSYSSMRDLAVHFAKPAVQAANLALMKDELAFIDPPASPAVLGSRVEIPRRARTQEPADGVPVPAHSPLFGERRDVRCAVPIRHRFVAGDGSLLQVHHVAGGDRGPIILAPGTAMTGLCFLTDTSDESFAEYLARLGWDVWLFDWRTSPLLEARQRPYTFDDVARHDWPAAVSFVRDATGAESVAVLAHCLSSPCFLLSLLRGYIDPSHIAAFVPSQVALHPIANLTHRIKVAFHAERFLPGDKMVHQSLDGPMGGMWDFAIGILARILPKTYKCDNGACHRHSATYGDIVGHDRLPNAVHDIMGDLVPEVHASFLESAAPLLRATSIMTASDEPHLGRLSMPMLLIGGAENQMFVPESTTRSAELLRSHCHDQIETAVFDDFGHLDCWFGTGADVEVWPTISEFLGRVMPTGAQR